MYQIKDIDTNYTPPPNQCLKKHYNPPPPPPNQYLKNFNSLMFCTTNVSPIILSLQKAGKPSLKFAWLLDKLKVERDRNHSIDSKSRRVETSIYNMVVIDCPGHRNYVHNMITGISQVTSSAKIRSFLQNLSHL